METDWAGLMSRLDGMMVDSAKHYTCQEPLLLGRLHEHEYQFHITYVVSGSGKVQIGSSKQYARQTDILFIRPREAHTSIDDERTKYELIEVKFSTHNPEVEELVPPLRPFIHVKNVAVLVPALERLVAARLVDMRPDSWLSRVRLAEVLMLLAKEVRLQNILESSTTETELKVRQVAEYIAVHYSEILTLANLAEMVDLHPNHFASSFKKVMGVSPIEHAIRIRLHHAKEMLRTSDFSVNQISEICGFNSPQYFTRLFTQREGVSPRRYRQTCRT